MIDPMLQRDVNAQRSVCGSCEWWDQCDCIGGCEKVLEYLEGLEDEYEDE